MSLLQNEDSRSLRLSVKNKACEKFYRRHISDIGVRVYARRALTSEDKILSITPSLGEKTFLQVAQLPDPNARGL